MAKCKIENRNLYLSVTQLASRFHDACLLRPDFEVLVAILITPRTHLTFYINKNALSSVFKRWTFISYDFKQGSGLIWVGPFQNHLSTGRSAGRPVKKLGLFCTKNWGRWSSGNGGSRVSFGGWHWFRWGEVCGSWQSCPWLRYRMLCMYLPCPQPFLVSL